MINILVYAIKPRIIPVLLNVVINLKKASDGVTPLSKNLGTIIKKGCSNNIEINRYPINLWIAKTFTILIFFTKSLFVLVEKN